MEKSIFSIVLISILGSNIVDKAYGASTFDFNEASKAAAILETQIELTISLKKLKDFGPYFKMCVIYTRHLDGEQWFEYHRTEQYSGTNNPAFAEKVRVPFLFHEKRSLQFRIYSNSKKGVRDLNAHLFRGSAACDLHELIELQELELPLRLDDGKGKKMGLIVIYAEKLINNYDVLRLEFEGQNLKFLQWFFNKDPYFEIFKLVENNEPEHTGDKELDKPEPKKEYSLVYRSELNYFSNPQWYRFNTPINSLCNGNTKREIKVVCKNKQYIIGEFVTSLDEMQKQKSKFTLVKDTETGKLSTGEMSIKYFNLGTTSTFSDFMAGGLKIRCSIAIDFSSGHSEVGNSVENQYEEAIIVAVGALKDYIWDNKFATYGFGARTKDGIFRDDLCLNSRAEGVEGVLGAYRENLPKITSRTAANPVPMMERIGKEFGGMRSSTEYCILLVIMHGEISASLRSSFVDALKKFNYSPISVIILGMNDSHLSTMKDLYYENVHESQFSWNFTQFISINQITSKNTASYEYFKTELLAKLPGQVVKFMYNFNLKPGN